MLTSFRAQLRKPTGVAIDVPNFSLSESYNTGWSGKVMLSADDRGLSPVHYLNVLFAHGFMAGSAVTLDLLDLDASGDEPAVRKWPSVISAIKPVARRDTTRGGVDCDIFIVDPISSIALRPVWGVYRSTSAAEIVGGMLSVAAGGDGKPTLNPVLPDAPAVEIVPRYRQALSVLPYALAVGRPFSEWLIAFVGMLGLRAELSAAVDSNSVVLTLTDTVPTATAWNMGVKESAVEVQDSIGDLKILGVRRIWRTVSDKIRARPGECREFTMSDPFKPVDRDTPYLLPPSLQDWLPQEHLARFVVEIVDRLDLSELERAYRGRGKTPYHPSVMVALLFYGYATGVFSSRKLEQATYDSVAFRYITADTHPDHDTIAHFRKRFLEPLRGVFVQILVIAQAMGVLKIGTVSLDGTKVKANASKHKAMSWGYANRLEAQLREEVQTLLEQAARADTEASPGLDIPEELERREARLAAIERAKAEIERRAQERDEAEQAEYEEKLKRRRDTEKATGKKARGREPKAPVAGPRAKDQVNFTDEESRIMPSSEGFVQGYNAQAAVDIDSHLIVAEHVSDHTNDKQELAPALRCLDERQEAVGQPRALLADAGYFSDENVRRCEAEGIEPYIASGRERHHRPLADRLAPVPECPAQADGVAAMGHRMKTPEGRALYAKRKSTVETVFGVIKEVLGFRRFHLRGLEAVQGEWTLVCMAWNLKRMHVAVA